MFGDASVVATIQGRDDQRAKWNWMARRMLNGAAWLSARMPHEVITVSRALRRSYMEDFGRESTCIPNGATPLVGSTEELDTGVLDRFGLTDQPYLINVARVVPEKALDVAIKAFREVDTDHRFVIVGGAAGTEEFLDSLRRLAGDDERIVFTGPIYGDELLELVHRADAFVTASRLEGLPLALLEAVLANLPVVVSDIPPHMEVVGRDGPAHRVFRTGDVNDMTRALQVALAEIGQTHQALGGFRARVAEEFSWERITTLTEEVYLRAIGEVPVVDSPSSVPQLSYSQQLPA
jgi:glycosyltransferase involved in cell wall biosynthesis